MNNTDNKAKLENVARVQVFALAGNAYLTLVSQKTEKRFTYRVAKADNAADLFFVSVLTGSNNESDYTYLGTIGKGRFFHGKKSRLTADAPSARAWAWFWGYVAQGHEPPNCEVWHEGRCGRCGRKLTVPESVAMGIGPDCAEKGA